MGNPFAAIIKARMFALLAVQQPLVDGPTLNLLHVNMAFVEEAKAIADWSVTI